MPGVKWWTDAAAKALVGKRIVKVAYEDTFGDGAKGITFTLDDGTKVIVSQDDEGNGPGSLFLDNHLPDDPDIIPVIRQYRGRDC